MPTTKMIPCASCVDADYEVCEGIHFDEVTGTLLCNECYDFYYNGDFYAFEHYIAGDR